MKDSTVVNETFTLERDYDVSPAEVFRAWSDPEVKARWMGTFADAGADFEIDFRPGGHEVSRGAVDSGPLLTFETWFHDIVADERLVFSSLLSAGGRPMTASLTTVELRPTGRGTHLVLTQQGAFLDDREDPQSRARGVGCQLDALGQELGSAVISR